MPRFFQKDKNLINADFSKLRLVSCDFRNTSFKIALTSRDFQSTDQHYSKSGLTPPRFREVLTRKSVLRRRFSRSYSGKTLTPRYFQERTWEKALTPRFFQDLRISIAGKNHLARRFFLRLGFSITEKSPYAVIFQKYWKEKRLTRRFFLIQVKIKDFDLILVNFRPFWRGNTGEITDFVSFC